MLARCDDDDADRFRQYIEHTVLLSLYAFICYVSVLLFPIFVGLWFSFSTLSLPSFRAVVPWGAVYKHYSSLYLARRVNANPSAHRVKNVFPADKSDCVAREALFFLHSFCYELARKVLPLRSAIRGWRCVLGFWK